MAERRWHLVTVARRGFQQGLRAVCAWFGMFAVALAWMLAWFGLLGDPPQWLCLLGLPLGALLVWPLWLGSSLYAVSTDAEGWREWRWPCVVRRRRWDELLAVEADRLVTARGPLVVPPQLRHAEELLARGRAALGATDERDDVPVDIAPDQVAAWLGLPPDGLLVCDNPLAGVVAPRAVRLGCPVALGGCALALVLWRPVLLGWLVTYVGLVAGVVRWGTPAETAREVRASPDWLDVRLPGGWRRLAWGSLRALSGDEGSLWLLRTTQGDVRIPWRLRQTEPLLHAVRQALEARAQGLELPRLSGDVPETALSRATLDADVTRGLSRGAEPNDA